MIQKLCSCCATEEERAQDKGTPLVVLKTKTAKKGNTFVACPKCDGNLLDFVEKQ